MLPCGREVFEVGKYRKSSLDRESTEDLLQQQVRANHYCQQFSKYDSGTKTEMESMLQEVEKGNTEIEREKMEVSREETELRETMES